MNLHDAIEKYIKLRIIGLGSGIMMARRIRQHLHKLGNPDLELLTEEGIKVWMQDIAKQHPVAANNALKDLRSVLNKMGQLGEYKGNNPAMQVKKIRVRHRTQVVPHEAVPALMQSIEAEESEVFRLYFLWLICTACRRSEALNVRWTDVDLVSGIWTMPVTKNGKPHRLPLPQVLVDRLRALPQTNLYIFSYQFHRPYSIQSVWQAWDRIRTRAGLTHIRIHDLRRTKATRLAEQGISVHLLKYLLNHASLQTTTIYVGNVHSCEQVREALEDDAKALVGV